jgi:hypothetical protein
MAYTYSGTVYVDTVAWAGIPVRLYRRNTGALVSGTTSVSGGHFEMTSPYNEEHYIVALYSNDNTNALIYDWMQSTVSG